MGNVGLCSCCLNDLGDTSLQKKATQKKLRPLISELEEMFEKHAGKDQRLDQTELINIWKESAQKKVGKLSQEDISLIEQSTKEAFKKVDLNNSGVINWHEFLTFMMGGAEERGTLKQMQSQLNKRFQKDPAGMQELIDEFRRWDKDGDGYVTEQELEDRLAYLEEMAERAEAEGGKTVNKRGQVKTTNAVKRDTAKLRKMKEEIFAEADVDADGKIDLWEVMAHALGRRKQPVEILLYDISAGAAQKFGKFLVGKKVMAVHSGLLVYGSEYWYGGKVFKTPAPCTKCFGNPLKTPWDETLPNSEFDPTLPVVKCGYTFVTQEEFTSWLSANVVKRYTGIEQYDLLSHSCNHFANECVKFLTGEFMPDRILELQKMALSPTLRALRPFLNKYLGGFAEADKDIDENYLTKEEPLPLLGKSQSAIDNEIDKVAQAGDAVVVTGIDAEPVIATIIGAPDKDGKLTVKYFDPQTHHIATKQVKKEQIQIDGK
mmetsp:Transcript_155874/g.283513  ORF Transcript_155874/g.283513 Transcript_155874/m.283513 type:complete len:489 (+) Transcript_155874:89-1555(+)